MRNKDTLKLEVLRGLKSLATHELTTHGKTPQDELTDEEMLALVRRAVKQRKDAAEQFRSGGRVDLAEKEEAELVILEVYLPQLMSKDEIRPVVEKKAGELGATDKSSMGKLIGAVMGELKGKADGADVKEVVEERFS